MKIARQEALSPVTQQKVDPPKVEQGKPAAKPQSSFGATPAQTPGTPIDVKSAAPQSPIEKATAGLLRLKAAIATLGPETSRVANDINITLELVKLEGGSTYGRLDQVLDRMKDLFYSELKELGPAVPADVRADFQKIFLETFLDYLPAVGAALGEFLDEAVATPNRATFSTLEERGRYAASAAAGSGKAENQGFARLAEEFVKAEPAFALQVAAARQKLGIYAEEVNQKRLDMIGVPNAGVSVEERARLLNIDVLSVTKADLTARLDAAERAMKAGAGLLASSIINEASSAIWPLNLLVLPLFGTPPTNEAEFAARREKSGNKTPQLSMADYKELDARVKKLRDEVNPLSRQGSLDLLRLLIDKKLDGLQDLLYSTSSQSVSEALSPEQRTAAQGMLAEVTRAQVAERQQALDQALSQLAGASRFGAQHVEALRAYRNLPSDIELRPEVEKLPADLKTKIQTEVETYETARAAFGAQINALYTATRTFVEKEYEAIKALPQAQQRTAAQALYQTAQTLDVLDMWLPRELTGNTSELVNEIYVKSRE